MQATAAMLASENGLENLNSSTLISPPHIKQSFSALCLPPSIISVLHSAGFTNTQDLHDISARELSRELGISMDNALLILTEAKQSSSAPRTDTCGSSGADIINSHPATARSMQLSSQPLNMTMSLPIITFCRGIDSALGGGIPSGQVTELCGVPGIGKL